MRRTRTLIMSWSKPRCGTVSRPCHNGGVWRHGFAVGLLAGVAALLLTIGLHAAEPPKERIPPPKEEAFTTDIIKMGGKDVRVERYEPKADGKTYPAIIMLPGVAGLDKTCGPLYRAQATRYAKLGYVVLIVHYLDRTDTGKEKLADIQERFSHFFDPTWVKKADDLKSMEQHFADWTDTVHQAVTYAGKLPNVDQKRIGLAGFSLGAALALRAAAEKEGQIAAVAELFGGLPPEKHKGIKLLPPTLMIHGDLDELVPPRIAYQMRKHLKAQKCPVKFKMYQEVEHLFAGAGFVDILNAQNLVDAFFKKHLQDAGADTASK